MIVEHIGYLRKSRNGRAVKLDISLESFLKAQRYVGKDEKEYVGLLVNMSNLLDVLDGKKDVTGINQIENKG